jgi:nucleoside-diphosphate-sugar epimerase
MESADAAGQRFLLCNGPAIEMKEIGATIKAHLGEGANRVPTRTIPNLAVRAAAIFSAQFRPMVADLGYAKKTSNEKARHVLGWRPRDPADAIVAAARSLIAKNLVKM